MFGNLDSCAAECELIGELSSLIEDIRQKVERMQLDRREAKACPDAYSKALAYSRIAENIRALRKLVDRLEEITDNRLWPLPKYRELLFIS